MELELYYKNNNIKLNGYWENNLLLNGTEYWENKAIKYEGSFKDDKYFGESIIYLNNGNIHYEASTFLNEYKYGNGKEYDCCNQLIYDGDWINNMKTGYGKIYKNNLLYYSGFLLNNKKEGHGKLFLTNTKYIGNFSNDYYDGHGNLFNNNFISI